MVYGCLRFFDIYRHLSSSLDLLVETLVENSHKTLKDLKQEFVDDDEKINTFHEIKILTTEDRYTNHSIKDVKKRFPRWKWKSGRSFKYLYIWKRSQNFEKTISW